DGGIARSSWRAGDSARTGNARLPHKSDLRGIIGDHATVHCARSRRFSLQARIQHRKPRIIAEAKTLGDGQGDAVLSHMVPVALAQRVAVETVRRVRQAGEPRSLHRADDSSSWTVDLSCDGSLRTQARAAATGVV